MRLSGARRVQTPARFAFGSAPPPSRCRDGPGALDPRRRQRMPPGAVHRPTAGDQPQASRARVPPRRGGADPRAAGRACGPRGGSPAAPERRQAGRRQAGAAPGPHGDRPRPARASSATPPRPRRDRRRHAADHPPLTRQGWRVGSRLGPGQLLEAGHRSARPPTRRGGGSPAAPPSCRARAERPRRRRSGQPEQAVARVCCRREAGVGRVRPGGARGPRPPAAGAPDAWPRP
jgi:hypothetical protein